MKYGRGVVRFLDLQELKKDVGYLVIENLLKWKIYRNLGSGGIEGEVDVIGLGFIVVEVTPRITE